MKEGHDNDTKSTASAAMTRRRALGLGAAVAGGVWAAPVIMSFDAASATSSGGATTTTTYVAPPTSSSTTSSSTTTTTTAAPRTITASVTGSAYGFTNPAPVTVPVGQPIDLVFTHSIPGDPYSRYIYFETVNGTAIAGVDFTGLPSQSASMASSDSSRTITIQTTATGAGPNTAFVLHVYNPV